jgi:hypothetical protein
LRRGLQLAAILVTPATLAAFRILNVWNGEIETNAGKLLVLLPLDSKTRAAITENNPHYRLPGKLERDFKLFEFRKTRFLYMNWSPGIYGRLTGPSHP